MANRGDTTNKIPSAIGDHFINYPECSKNYNDNKFTMLTKGRTIYLLSVLDSLFIKTYKRKLCKQKLVYNTNLYKVL